MVRPVVDANVLIAARLARDQDHERGIELTRAFDHGDLPTALVLSDSLEETLNYLATRSSHEVAVETLDAIVERSGFEIHYAPKADFDAGRSVFRTHEGLSLTDAVLVASMQRQNLNYLYSFDDDFDRVNDLTRLTTPDDPARR
jgi:predicted nucleic acid-binding protein